MIAFVMDSQGNIGHPTRNCRMVRRLLKKGKAKVIAGGIKKGQPLLIQLLDKVFNKSKTTNAEFRIGIDPGYKHIGYSLFKIYKNHIELLLSGEVETRTSKVTENLSNRKMYRNARRYYRRKNVKRKFGKAKFRHPRWKNRAKHAFQPTHRHLINSHINLLKWLFKRVPKNQCEVHLEYSKFDVQKIINPNIHSWQYQHGPQYNFENVKAYIRDRDNYTCQICKKKIANIQNEVHHIIPRSKGGSDRPDNLILLCQNCHAKVHAEKVSCTSNLIKNKNFRDTGVLNSCMKWMFDNFSKKVSLVKTFGYITKTIRLNSKISKTHAHDAMIIALCNEDGPERKFKKYTSYDHHVTVNFKQYHRHVRNWINQYKDRKYYIINSKYPKKTVAWNRNRRSGQDKKKQSLTELKRYLLDNKILNKVQIIVKPSQKVYRQNNKNILFRPGDIIKCSKGIDVVRGWSSTQRRIITENLGIIKQKDCTKILNNAGMCIV